MAALIGTTVLVVHWQTAPSSSPVDAGALPTRPVVTTAPPGTSPLIVVPVLDRNPLGSHPAKLEELPDHVAVAPVRVRIDHPGIDGPVVTAGVEAGGAMDVGKDPSVLAWYRYGPSPGESGSAVIAGHVDYNGRTGVFYRLADVGPGAAVVVTYADHSERRFRVVARRHYPKSNLPVGEIFSRSGKPRLVLITCGGEFDDAAHSYRENVVVYADPVS